MWIYGTISESLLNSVLKTQCTARELWLTLENLFQDNKEARAIQLENELRNLQIGDFSVTDYCQKLKSISDILINVNSPITKRSLVMHMLNGLSSKFDNIINVIKHRTPPWSFGDARSMLKNEEDRLKTKRLTEFAHVDNASSPQLLMTTTLQSSHLQPDFTNPYHYNNNNRGNRGRGRGRNNYNQNWNPQPQWPPQQPFWPRNNYNWPPQPPPQRLTYAHRYPP